MLDKLDAPTKIILSVLAFPIFFQEQFLYYAWGQGDEYALAVSKKLFLFLPTLSVIFGCWMTVACLLTVPFRQRRLEFISFVFVTWWDLGRSIFAFWGGIVKFFFLMAGWIVGLLRLGFLTFLLIVQDIILFPIRMLSSLSSSYLTPGIPWPAISLTLFWSFLEALIFTFVMTPLVSDTLSGIAGKELSGLSLQIPLYLTFVVFVLGSYAALQKFGEALKAKQPGRLITYALVEFVIAAVEIVFLYREFVDALEPWFAQHAGTDFRLGLLGTFMIAGFAWLGIRAMTWFLFAEAGLPPILAMLQKSGSNSGSPPGGSKSLDPKDGFVFINIAIDKSRTHIDWLHERGEHLLSAFVLPPLQIVAAAINFCTLCLSASHLFDLPFKSYKDVLRARTLFDNARDAVQRQK